jgi:hypothetical protein
MTRLPPAPSGIGPRGRRLWRSIVGAYALADHELVLLAEACRVVDRLEEIRAVVERDGSMVVGSKNQMVMHPGILEERQQRDLLARLIARLSLPADDEAEAAGRALGHRGAAARWYGTKGASKNGTATSLRRIR